MEIQTPQQWTPYATSKQCFKQKVNCSINLNNKTTVDLTLTNSSSNNDNDNSRHKAHFHCCPVSPTANSSAGVHPSLSEILKENVLTRGRALERLDQNNHSCCTGCHDVNTLFPCTACWHPLQWTRQSTKGNEFTLDIEDSAGKCKQASTLVLCLFLKALEESGVCSFL